MSVRDNILNGTYDNRIKYSTETRSEYRNESDSLVDKFRDDIIAEYGLTNHPKAQRLFEIAWDLGHSNGYEEVRINFDLLYELLT